MPLRKIDERVGPDGKTKKIIKKKDKKKARDRLENNLEDLPRGLQIDTTTGEGANITKMREGGYCRGAGAAIKGTKFEGVF
jgi:hypothetical protein